MFPKAKVQNEKEEENKEWKIKHIPVQENPPPWS